MSIKTYLDIGGAIAFLILVLVIVHHLETVGENRIKAQDAQALQAAQAKMLEQESQMKAQADKAEATRDATQKQLDDFRAANPVGHVFVCSKAGAPTGVPKATSPQLGNADPGSGPAPVPEVPAGSVDIGTPLDTIVYAAGVLGSLYREYQGYPDTGEVGTAQQ